MGQTELQFIVVSRTSLIQQLELDPCIHNLLRGSKHNVFSTGLSDGCVPNSISNQYYKRTDTLYSMYLRGNKGR